MRLREVHYKEDYRTGYDDIVADLIQPSLQISNAYWRAVGYFSSSALEAFGGPLGAFIQRGGSIRLVTSIELSQADLEAIERGISKQKICSQRLDEIIEEQFSDGVGDGTVRLGLLLEMGRLEIRIAVPKLGTGIYHEKIGIFLSEEDYVAFSGSSNESRNAFENNRECIDVYPSWSSPVRAKRKLQHFKEVWDGADKGVEVYSFPEAVKSKLIRICEKSRSHRTVRRKKSKKWRHQDEALEKFLAAERGILDMATGTGKTRTALKILVALFHTGEIDTVIVCTKGTDLLDQWYGELLAVRKNIGSSVRVFRHYDSLKQLQEFTLSPKDAFLIVSREPSAMALKQLSPDQGYRTLLIHDEVHGLGSSGNRFRLAGLSDHIRYRLGLSATPERPYDDDGNRFIKEHIGPVLMTFGLREAIERGILAPFNYHPLPYQPTDDDRDRVAAVYRRKKAREAAGEPMSETELWIQIARVYKTSGAKLPVFAEFIKDNHGLLERCIVFVETMEYGHSVLEIVHKYRSDFHTYFSGEEQSTLRRFAWGDLECLITCHRLSEGIDIKSLNTVILFSSEKGQLETIQRMGRCLRTNPDDPEKIANIVDFIREPDENPEPNADEVRRDWLTELSQFRAIE